MEKINNLYIYGCKKCNTEIKKRIRWSKDKVNEYLEEIGVATRLESKYTKSKDNTLIFRCGCGNTFSRSWTHVKNNQQYICGECSGHITWSKDKVNKCLKNIGVDTRLESEYTNSYDNTLIFRCSCGNTFHRSWNNVKDGQQYTCKECNGIITWTKDKINEFLEEIGIDTKLESKYTNNKDNTLIFRCGCGNTFHRSWSSVKDHQIYTCEECNGYIFWSKDKVNEYLKSIDIDTRLESEYTNNHDNNLIFRCGCGNTFHRSWHDVKNQQQYTCKECSEISSHGEKTVEKFLNELGIKYESEKTFDDLKDRSKLRVDFFIIDDRYSPTKIEINGEFHFKSHYKDDNGYINTQKQHDEMKREHSKKHGHGHIEINYFVTGYVKLEDGTIIEGVKKGDEKTLKRIIVTELEKYRIINKTC